MSRAKSVNAVTQRIETPEYADAVILDIRAKGMTMAAIAARAGVTSRTLYRATEFGFANFPMQFVLETLAGRR